MTSPRKLARHLFVAAGTAVVKDLRSARQTRAASLDAMLAAVLVARNAAALSTPSTQP